MPFEPTSAAARAPAATSDDVSAARVYVSITGLRLRSPLHLVGFWFHASRSMSQALRADGLLSADARIINGVHHTMSVWRDEKAMRAYVAAGAHARAMRAFRGMAATGRTLGFSTHRPPRWSEVHELLRVRGRDV